jgi:hypothetical protein
MAIIKKRVIKSTDAETGNPKKTILRKNIIGRTVAVTKSKDEYGRKTKEKMSQNPRTGTVKVKSKTAGLKSTTARYPGTPMPKVKSTYKAPRTGEFNNQPKMDQ